MANMALAKGHSSKTKFQVSDSRTIGPMVGCYDILILDESPIKWRQRPDMTLAVDWDVKHQFKQTFSC